MINLEEGLRKSDLDGMVLPMISIDEFRSKIDDNKIIVVAFYCFEEDPAHDLSNFIERSNVQVQDTDVSPAPSKEGYYVTFIEMPRTPQFPERLQTVLDEVSRLTNIDEWQFTSLKLPKGKVETLTPDKIKQYVDIKPKPRDEKTAVKEWLSESSLSNVWIQGEEVILERQGITWSFTGAELRETVPQGGLRLDEVSNSITLRLDRLLEGGYQAHCVGDSVVIEHPYSSTLLILGRQER